MSVGMVGAGQLARMTHSAAIDLAIDLVVLARSEDDPAVRSGARYIIGEPDDPQALARLAAEVDVVTFDHELVPNDMAAALAEAGHQVRPGPRALHAAQDKLVGRNAFARAGLPVPDFVGIDRDPEAEVARFGDEHGWPVVIKSRTGGYDGRGVAVVSGPDEVAAALASLPSSLLLAECYVPWVQEVAVVGARSPSGDWVVYPPVATSQVDGICHELVMPAALAPPVAGRVQQLARTIAEALDATGVTAVEFFVTADDAVVVNEIALRPHNSGHATIEAAATSQFHNHLRAVLDWPLGDTTLRAPAAATVNVLGAADGSDPARLLPRALTVAGTSIHLYGKGAAPGRKLGHVTSLGSDPEETLARARRATALLTGQPTPP